MTFQKCYTYISRHKLHKLKGHTENFLCQNITVKGTSRELCKYVITTTKLKKAPFVERVSFDMQKSCSCEVVFIIIFS